MWRRWTREYMRGLRERHRMKYNARGTTISAGDIALVKSNQKNQTHWLMSKVVEIIESRDGVVRATKLRRGRDHLERAVQHLYPLELS